ncbi:MAG TPA: hypothetical protein VLK56_05005 [Solirubrobacterales bacterium]|nr:hypothetical protein [Solirubrobacterales bacterium]
MPEAADAYRLPLAEQSGTFRLRLERQTSQFKRRHGFMRTLVAAMTALSIAALAIAEPASAFEGGGRKPSEAPLLTVGQHYSGQLNNHKSDANYGGYKEVAIWRLPPLTTRDVVTVDWHSVPFTHSSTFPICLIFAQGVDDYTWGSAFGSTSSDYSCDEDGPVYRLSGSGSAQSAITAQETNPNSSYLEFFARAEGEEPSELETYPYDFTVEPIRHYLGVAISAVKQVRTNGSIYATATLASGAPAPDGLAFTLAATWPGEGSATYSAVSSAGALNFPLTLPETAEGKKATFVVSHTADAEYQAATSTKVVVPVAKAKAPAPSPCFIAERRELSLIRQYRRLARHARRAHGTARVVLHRRAARAKRQLHAARLRTESACGAG